MSELRSLPEWPRYREGAKEDERRWSESLSDPELAQHVAALAQVDRAVRAYRTGETSMDDARVLLVDYGGAA